MSHKLVVYLDAFEQYSIIQQTLQIFATDKQKKTIVLFLLNHKHRMRFLVYLYLDESRKKHRRCRDKRIKNKGHVSRYCDLLDRIIIQTHLENTKRCLEDCMPKARSRPDAITEAVKMSVE